MRSAVGGSAVLREPLMPYRPLGTWPTSGPADVRMALERLRGALPTGRERATLVLAAARRLEEDEERIALAAARLGLAPSEMGVHRRGLACLLERELARAPAGDGGGVAFCAPHWSELFAGVLLLVARQLRAGRRVLLAADPRLPMAADAVAAALLASGLPVGSLALLHGLSGEGEKAVFAAGPRGAIGAVWASGGRERIARLRALSHDAAVAEPRLRRLRCSAAEVRADDDPADAAQRVARAAFARAETLSGQRAGQLGRVWCAQRIFSRFTEELLEVLESSSDARRPLPLVDRAAAERVRRHLAVGLDEGATLIFGGGTPSETESDELCVSPIVFTNVESTMTCVRRQAPMPVLCLLRAAETAGRGEGRAFGRGAS